MVNAPAGKGSVSILILVPLNGTFEKKIIGVPLFPDTLRVGRQTNSKSVPSTTNGFFDSKVLSRQHAEIWSDTSSAIWIRDVKSSNGTFLNGRRLSQENKESEPFQIRTEDILELGIDIVAEDGSTIIHHKVAARVEYAGLNVEQPKDGRRTSSQHPSQSRGIFRSFPTYRSKSSAELISRKLNVLLHASGLERRRLKLTLGGIDSSLEERAKPIFVPLMNPEFDCAPETKFLHLWKPIGQQSIKTSNGLPLYPLYYGNYYVFSFRCSFSELLTLLCFCILLSGSSFL